VPDLADLPAYCKFRDRCCQVDARLCASDDCIALKEAEANHWVRCNLY
jgi:hypothetical protein